MTDFAVGPMDLQWRIFVTVMLLTLPAGLDTKVLRRLTILRDSFFVSTVYTLLAVDF